jgi:hypothetical protein
VSATVLFRRARVVLAPLAMLGVGACNADVPTVVTPPPNERPDTTTPPQGPLSNVAVSLVPQYGDGQWVPEHQRIRQQVRVRVYGAQSRPLAGKRVTFSVLQGGGRLTDTIATTDASGDAYVTSWTVGAADTPQRLGVRVDDLTTAVKAVAFPAVAPRPMDRVLAVQVNSVVELTGAGGPTRSLRDFPSRYVIATTGPNDSLVAFWDMLEDSVCVASLAGASRRCGSGAGYGSFSGFTWSADGAEMQFVGFRKNLCGTTACLYGPAVPLTVNLATMQVTRSTGLLGAGQGHQWSPDGRQVAFTQDGRLLVASANGSDARLIALPAGVSVSALRWSPNGRQLALGVYFPEQCPWSCDTGIGVVDVAGTGFRLLVNVKTSTGHEVGSPLWSPDGTQIAFQLDQLRMPEQEYVSEVFVVPPGGGSAARMYERVRPLSWR